MECCLTNAIILPNTIFSHQARGAASSENFLKKWLYYFARPRNFCNLFIVCETIQQEMTAFSLGSSTIVSLAILCPKCSNIVRPKVDLSNFAFNFLCLSHSNTHYTCLRRAASILLKVSMLSK